MTVEEFTATSIAILRSSMGWQTAIAARLGIDARTVRRWLKAGVIPAWAEEKLMETMGAADIAPWPRDEWLIGDSRGGDGQRREYVVHLQPPRFVARIVVCDEEGRPETGEMPADVVSGVVYTSNDYALCEIDWIDTPSPGEIVKWMEAAADAIDNLET